MVDYLDRRKHIMPSQYADVLEIKEARDHVLTQVARALKGIDSTRMRVANYKDLPALGVPYVLVESGTSSLIGISSEESSYYVEIDDEYITDTITGHILNIDITAAHNDPEVFLLKFATYLRSNEWWYTYFNSANVGVQGVSDITDGSLPTEGGDWEIRFKLTLTVNYKARQSRVTPVIATISEPVYIVN
jgi:hypothetical protein